MSDSEAKPAEGGERVFLYVLIVVASLFLLSNFIAEEIDWMFIVVPLFMILGALARLKGWVKLGGGPGVGGGGGGGGGGGSC